VGYLISWALGSAASITIDNSLLYVIPGSLVGGVGEALGWRCFLQSSLDKRFDYILAAAITGTLWGLWHVGHYSNGLLYMGMFLLFTISASAILAQWLRAWDYNLGISAAFHLSINLGFFVFFRKSLTDTNMMLVNALVWSGCAILIFVLGSRSKLKADKAKVI
jgi:membrane protease YdiL (CAAX protease family)